MLNKIYSYSPVFIQNLGVSIFGYFWKKRRFGGVFKSELKSFRSRNKFSVKQWEDYQTTKLRELLVHAFTHVPFYKKKYNSHAIKLKHLENFKLDQLSTLPFLEKDELRKFGDSTLMSKTKDSGNYFSSSGSTGTPTKIHISKQVHQKWSAGFEVRIRNWAGINYKAPRGTIGGRKVVSEGNDNGPYYRYNFIEKQVYFSAYHISKNTVSNYLEGMIKHKIEYMTGYAMSNFFLARFIEENGLKAPKLKAVITSSEKLTDDMRRTFERVYQCQTFDSYSGVEMCGLISECKFGSLHISPDLGVLEILKSNGEYAKPGESGELVCTGLVNFNQPLIRYKIGDEVTLSTNQKCACNIEMPIIKEIIGRVEDTIIGPDGRKIVRFHNIFTNLSKIIKGQIIQHAINMFEVKLVVSSPLFKNEEKEISNRMISQLGDVNIFINEVPEISKNKNGKFQSVISKI
tara:strand:+ start:2482 stop:3858 length:1377 start_codon:yes stop_codon:yes gene_type:complete